MTEPLRILVKRDELTLEGIKQFFVAVEKEEWKFDTLCDLYDTLTITQVGPPPSSLSFFFFWRGDEIFLDCCGPNLRLETDQAAVLALVVSGGDILQHEEESGVAGRKDAREQLHRVRHARRDAPEGEGLDHERVQERELEGSDHHGRLGQGPGRPAGFFGD